MTYRVALENQGQAFWLRGTTWTSDRARAAQFATIDSAKAALEVASKFMKAGPAFGSAFMTNTGPYTSPTTDRLGVRLIPIAGRSGASKASVFDRRTHAGFK